MYQQLIEEFVQQERLPSSYLEDASRCFLPLIQDIESRLDDVKGRPLILGINGAQGTGKSTLAKLLAALLESNNCRVAKLSIDDFYFSKAHRATLATAIHPLLKSRGVPGTHDVGLALRVIHKLCEATVTDQIVLPGFDKANDDCRNEGDCVEIHGPIDVIILEGWFIGATPQTDQELEPAINELESSDDADGLWRRYVNQQLAADYQTLFERLDLLLMLKAPGFQQVLEWRCLQEQKLRWQADNTAIGLMDEDAIRHFIQHFERLTKHCLCTLPEKADRVFELDEMHRIHCPTEASL